MFRFLTRFASPRSIVGLWCAGLLAVVLPAASSHARDKPEAAHEFAVLPPTTPAPPDNPATPERISLGRQLFFDPRLSGDGKTSCATCHLPDRALGDGLSRSRGIGGKRLDRNTPTLWNVGFYANYFWDGRAKTLEQQALAPIESPAEMNQPLDDLESELAAISGYAAQFRHVFGTGVTRRGIAMALAAFERSLITGRSAFDRYLQGEQNALSDDALRGLELFTGEAGCARCHNGSLLSDGKYYRLGVSWRDPGRAGVTGRADDQAKFRTPSLRNVAETGPYMHDGSLASLYDVVLFYFRGVPAQGPDGLRPDVQTLQGLSIAEIPAIVAFLESLSGETRKIAAPDLP